MNDRAESAPRWNDWSTCTSRVPSGRRSEKQGTEQATDAIERAFEYRGYDAAVGDDYAEAQKSKKAGIYRLARDIYKKYLDNFAQTDGWSVYETCEQARRLRFNAEILYSLKEFRQALSNTMCTWKRTRVGTLPRTRPRCHPVLGVHREG